MNKNIDHTITEDTITDRELFVYVATSLSVNPMLNGLDKQTKTRILKKMLKEMGLSYITNLDVYQIMQTLELFREKLGLSLNKILDVNSLSIVRQAILSNPELINQSIKQIENNPDLIKKISDVLSKK